MSFSKTFLILLTGACGLLLAACGTSIDASPTATSSASYPLLAPVAPPPNLYEDKPENPHPGQMTWRAGYWDYTGSSFNWVAGEYIPSPSPTAVWVGDSWSRHTYGWGFVPGHWQ